MLRHRGALAATLAAVAVYLVVHSLTAPPPPTETVWVAAHDLHSGATITRGDLVRREYAAGTAPDRIIADPARVDGRVLAIPVGAGMPVRRDAVVGSRWLHGYPGRSAVPVRITDAAITPLLEVGSRVDLIASDPQRSGSARTVVRQATILALPTPVPDDSSPLGGRLVVVGVPAADVDAVAAAGVQSYLTVVWPSSDGGS